MTKWKLRARRAGWRGLATSGAGRWDYVWRVILLQPSLCPPCCWHMIPWQVPGGRVMFSVWARCAEQGQPNPHGGGNGRQGRDFPVLPFIPPLSGLALGVLLHILVSILFSISPWTIVADLHVILTGMGILQMSSMSTPQLLLFAP